MNCPFKPAITRLETARGITDKRSGFTPQLDQWLTGANGRAAKMAPEINEMKPVPKEALRKVFEAYI